MLRTFGGLSLDSTTSPVQRKRLLVLAVLAAAGPSGIGRDAMLALFWGEGAEADARNSLKQALFALRRAVGERAVVADGLMLRLDAAALPSDVATFAAALAGHDDAVAVTAYRGPFLDGVPLPGNPQNDALERWVSERRAALAGQFRDALRRLTADAAACGDWSAATAWAERLAADDPLDRAATRAFVRTLVAAGELPRARRQVRVYDQLAAAELRAGPDAELAALAAPVTTPGRDSAALPRGPESPAPRRPPESHDPVGESPPAPSQEPATIQTVHTPAAAPAPVDDPYAALVGRRRVAHPAALGVLGVAAILAAAQLVARASAPPATPERPSLRVVAVEPFRVVTPIQRSTT